MQTREPEQRLMPAEQALLTPRREQPCAHQQAERDRDREQPERDEARGRARSATRRASQRRATSACRDRRRFASSRGSRSTPRPAGRPAGWCRSSPSRSPRPGSPAATVRSAAGASRRGTQRLRTTPRPRRWLPTLCARSVARLDARCARRLGADDLADGGRARRGGRRLSSEAGDGSGHGQQRRGEDAGKRKDLAAGRRPARAGSSRSRSRRGRTDRQHTVSSVDTA